MSNLNNFITNLMTTQSKDKELENEFDVNNNEIDSGAVIENETDAEVTATEEDEEESFEDEGGITNAA